MEPLELEILLTIANRQGFGIIRQMGVSSETIHECVEKIAQKLNVSSYEKAVEVALARGVIKGDEPKGDKKSGRNLDEQADRQEKTAEKLNTIETRILELYSKQMSPDNIARQLQRTRSDLDALTTELAVN